MGGNAARRQYKLRRQRLDEILPLCAVDDGADP
jgi:hypothetical protein